MIFFFKTGTTNMLTRVLEDEEKSMLTIQHTKSSGFTYDSWPESLQKEERA